MSQTSPVTERLLAGLSRVLLVMESARHPRNSNIISIWEDDVKAIKAVENYLRCHAKCSQEAREKEIIRLATIEECAQVCEGHAWTRHATNHSPTKSCAIAIRALADTSTDENSK